MNSRTEKHLDYLKPSEQLIIGAAVNRICEGKNLNPEMISVEAIKIILALDSRIESVSKFRLDAKFSISDDNEDGNLPIKRFVGATPKASFPVKNILNSEEEKNIVLGKGDEYRIGNYIATRKDNKKNRTSTLNFVHFFGQGGANMALDIEPPVFELTYKTETLELIEVCKEEAMIVNIFGIHFVRYKPTDYLYRK